MKDYYKVLGVDKNSSPEDIKKAYRKLAHQFHPHKAGKDEKKFKELNEKLKEINEAYNILSNAEKKAQYDKFGQVFSAQGGPASGWEGVPFSDFGFSADGGFDVGGVSDLGDIFNAIFEGMGVRQKRRTYKRGSDLEFTQEVSLEESFRGIEKTLKFKTFLKCSKCKGKGHDEKAGFEKCTVCGGRGEIRETKNTFFGSFAQVKTCEKCFGTGQVPNKVCEICKGAGRIAGEREVKIQILPGVRDGQLIKIAGMGEAGERQTAEGDLYVRIKVRPHSVFERAGDNLKIKKDVKLVDLLLSKKLEIPTISGNKLSIEIPAGFDIKQDLRIGGEGMPIFGSYGRGDLLVELMVKTPRKLNEKTKKILEDLGKTMDNER
ncbi:MAG: DnaJ C-terminal domain-containing protein [Candidatus Paceibacterota bacterium]|jgi:molecular chaperone DnaJ